MLPALVNIQICIDMLFFKKHPIKTASKCPYSEGGVFMTTNQTEEIIRLQREGKGYKTIAAMLGVPLSSVKSWCKRHSDELEQTGFCLQCGARVRIIPHKKRRRFCSDKQIPEETLKRAFNRGFSRELFLCERNACGHGCAGRSDKKAMAREGNRYGADQKVC